MIKVKDFIDRVKDLELFVDYDELHLLVDAATELHIGTRNDPPRSYDPMLSADDYHMYIIVDTKENLFDSPVSIRIRYLEESVCAFYRTVTVLLKGSSPILLNDLRTASSVNTISRFCRKMITGHSSAFHEKIEDGPSKEFADQLIDLMLTKSTLERANMLAYLADGFCKDLEGLNTYKKLLSYVSCYMAEFPKEPIVCTMDILKQSKDSIPDSAIVLVVDSRYDKMDSFDSFIHSIDSCTLKMFCKEKTEFVTLLNGELEFFIDTLKCPLLDRLEYLYNLLREEV